ncbi:unnamed protein product [Ectocarpus sp. 4 AP-2014]
MDTKSFRSDHPAGAHFCYVDGHVEFLDDDIVQSAYEALSTRMGGEIVTDY